MPLIIEMRGDKPPRQPEEVIADLRLASHRMETRMGNPYVLLREAADLIEDLSASHPEPERS